ncbi:uncharacterized protein C8A04DRAFT_9506 [Dichotomopilus funicola]|uniref:tRNA nucleotidyltransferase n=1 Tax=Dichotomopilus funicola TaxID=1934379 RepID=A0AAN6V8D2_9PEZI|nr:hypothetical protein C8A04DRAFT_9506 [Dichotomopilus funicola]
MAAALPKIELTEREGRLRSLLNATANNMNRSSTPPRKKVELRWAGGWVRDKLLGIPSHDIDVAINSVTGEEFAAELRRYCETDGVSREYGLGPDDMGRLHTIARNPDKSKHLATTNIKLWDLDLDFVNLRRESYTADSRNPTVEFGTAQEDALRRDATVNALFYNLKTGLVEDLVGGLDDMKRKLIRTPLAPLQTFLDDPLRVLRLVRFASRLGFTIDPTTEEVMADENVLHSLLVKISRERVGVELEKMMKGEHPVESLRLIDRLQLYHAIFTNPEQPDMAKPDLSTWATAYECLDFLKSTKKPGSIYDLLITGDDASYYAWSLVGFTPWTSLSDAQVKTFMDNHNNSGRIFRSPPTLSSQVARDGFRAPNKLCDLLNGSIRNRAQILEFRNAVRDKDDSRNERDRIGMAIRSWNSQHGEWRLQVLYAILVDVAERVGPLTATGAGESDAVLAEWQEFLDHIVELDLMDVLSIKRLVDGKTLMRALQASPGRWTGPALDVALAWQLRNPGVEDPTGAIEAVRARRAELGIDSS